MCQHLWKTCRSLQPMCQCIMITLSSISILMSNTLLQVIDTLRDNVSVLRNLIETFESDSISLAQDVETYGKPSVTYRRHTRHSTSSVSTYGRQLVRSRSWWLTATNMCPHHGDTRHYLFHHEVQLPSIMCKTLEEVGATTTCIRWSSSSDSKTSDILWETYGNIDQHSPYRERHHMCKR